MAQNFWGDELPDTVDLPPAHPPPAWATAASILKNSPTRATWAAWSAPTGSA